MRFLRRCCSPKSEEIRLFPYRWFSVSGQLWRAKWHVQCWGTLFSESWTSSPPWGYWDSWDTPAACFLSVLVSYSQLGGIRVQGITFWSEFGNVATVCFFPNSLDLSQTRQGPNKSWQLCQETEHTQLPRWFQSLLFCSLFQVMSLQESNLGSIEVCSWEQVETHFSATVHTRKWVLITCGYNLPFSYFLSMSFLLVTAVKFFPALRCPW